MSGEPLGVSGEPLAIAFDWGGVFTEGTFDSSAARELSALYRLPLAELEPAYLALMADFEVGAFDMAGFHRRLEARLGAAGVTLEAFRATFLGAVRERPATYRLLAGLPAGMKLGMLSNNVPELCDLVRHDPRLARIEAFLFSNELGVRKPDARAYEALAAALGLPPQRIVFVDDNETNIDACEALGFTGLLLDDRESFAARWRAALPHLPLPSGFATSGMMSR